jgi:hypothetical protein
MLLGGVDPEPPLGGQLLVDLTWGSPLPVALPHVFTADLFLAERADGGPEQLLLGGEFVIHMLLRAKW